MWWLVALDSNKHSRRAEWQLTSLTPTKDKQEEEQDIDRYEYLFIWWSTKEFPYQKHPPRQTLQ